ncbi:AAA family ATPase [Flavobacterium sp. LS1R47]|uniref:AAA family ATPase n=1 Tax=Flavobacterium frigoritolerans TaxID=2987686 RepID=A0A9X2ZGD6_9FLAO|nr:AAA family ATPase [Flavobacterium frigoritolerans]MCV9930856.1 AAA family ATPase [Flavobacterium frigoritolerans]
MKIKSIYIENFRSAKDLKIDFDDNLNVLVGVNGAGKTTILETLTLCLSWLIKRIQRQNSSGLMISESDIRYNSSFACARIVCVENDKEYSWELIKFADGKIIDKKSDLVEVSDLALHFQRILDHENRLPVIGYYPVSRVVDKITPEVRFDDTFSTLDAYDKALDGKQNFSAFFEWFRQQDDIVNEKATSRDKWILQNKVSIKRRVDKIFKLLKSSLHDNEEDSEKFDYLRRRINKDEYIYEHPRFLFREIFRTIEDLFYHKIKQKDKIIFDYLEENFLRMEMYSEDESLKQFDKIYSSLLHRTIESFFLFIDNENDLIDDFLQVLIELFIFSNEINLWWLSDVSRKKIENVVRTSLSEIEEDKKIKDSKFDLEIKQLESSIFRIISQEIRKKKNLKGKEGREMLFVKKAIEQFLPDYTNLRVRRIPRPHMLIDKENLEFNLNQLSDGEKNLITLIGDIARRLAIANPESDNPLEGNGVIMIDEVDLHLHPKWQQLMIPQLEKIFPNCQFIVSTHSPQVLNNVQPDNIILLENNNNVLRHSFAIESYGKNSDRILEDLLGVDARPTNIKNEIEELYRFIELGEIDKAKNLYKDLSNKIIGGDPELAKANVLIKRKEITGK